MLLALIPARGGSKGIPHKNIRNFCGKPLLQWAIDAALDSKFVDLVVVSTDDNQIAEIAKAGGAEVPFLRPAELAGDTVPGIAPVIHALEEMPQVSDILLLQPTSPLRSSFDLDAIVELRAQTEKESAVSVTLTNKHPAWMYTLEMEGRMKPLVLNRQDITFCRQQLPEVYVLNGALYLASRDFVLREQSLISDDTIGYVMPPERSVDIDTPLDWQWAEFLMTQML